MTDRQDQILDALKQLSERVESLEKAAHIHGSVFTESFFGISPQPFQPDIGVGDKPHEIRID